jgi:iron complex outermembrane receptor protein
VQAGLAILLGARLAVPAQAGTAGPHGEPPRTVDDLLTMGLAVPGLDRDARGREPSRDVLTTVVQQLGQLAVISASLVAQSVHEAPAIISTISAAELASRGYRSVAEVLQSLPGFDVIEDHTRSNVGVRGINAGLRGWSRVLKVMVDGHPIAFRPSTENWLGPELIPLEVVDRIEVIRGPGSSLYGADAFLGVVNIITKRRDQLDGGALTASAGTFATNPAFAARAAAGFRLGELDLVLAGQAERSDRSGLAPWEVPGRDSFADDARSDRAVNTAGSAFVKGRWSRPAVGTLRGSVHYQRLDSVAEFADWAVLTHSNRISLHAVHSALSFERKLGARFHVDAATGHALMRPTGAERLALSRSGLADFVTRDLETQGLDTTARLRGSFGVRSSVAIGTDLQLNRHVLQTFHRHFEDRTSPEMEEAPRRTFVNAGLFVLGILSPLEWFDLRSKWDLGVTLSGRFEHHNVYGSTPNGRINFVLHSPYGAYLKLLFGTSFKAPSADQLFTRPLAPGDVIGNPDLKPERARTFEGQLGYLLGDRGAVTATIFHSAVSNAIALTTESTTSNIVTTNAGETSSIGVEGELRIQHRGIGWWANATWQKSAESRSDPLLGRFEVPTRLFPALMMKSGLHLPVPLPAGLLYGEARYVGSRIASDQNIKAHDPVNRREYRLSAYLLLDAALGCQLRWLRQQPTALQLRVTNLLDTRFAYPGFGGFDIPGEPRTFHLQISQRF